MNRKLLILIIYPLLIVMLPGCWNRRELSSLSIVQAIGIDKTEDGQINLSIQIIKPGEIKSPSSKEGGGGSGQEAVWISASTGKTFFDALRNATFESSRKLYLSHCTIVIIGEEVAKSGIGPILDFWGRDHEPQLTSFILVAKGMAKDIIEGRHLQEKIPSKAIENLVKGTYATSKAPRVNFLDVLKSFYSKSSDPFITGIEITSKKSSVDLEKLIKLDHTAIFKKDKLIGWFNGKETRGLLWILNEVKSGILVVKSPDDEDKDVSLEIIKASSKVKPEIIDGNIVITVDVKEEGNMGEQMADVNLSKPDVLKELEARQAAVIKDEIQAALNKAQREWGADIFKFGEEIHRKFPKEWKKIEKRWDKEIRNIEVRVVVETKLRRTGLSIGPINVKK
ncbi:Ger(x)C family spore germination protein [Fonticella tunisiensis]|uniref:Spore germination protein KC n=1 Tax=Fonticella tunisiensis TaxID=1096341 RepID=A0A4R7KBU0_9CLOT|nr:Ger(x)C family spore germination protein [Fonticella tunisiensis]TDT51946.1 spore germination protein KC [Fonticella tunisiensis]